MALATLNLGPRQPITSVVPPDVSIVVPLRCGPAQALRCFEGIAAQAEVPRHEIVVVDDASAALEDLLGRLAGEVRVLRNERRAGFAAAAWRGVEQCHGEIVVVVRDGAAPAPGWLAPLASALDDPAVGLAVSATAGEESTSPVTAWSFAMRTGDLRVAGVPILAEELVLGALALQVAERGLRVITVPDSLIEAPSGDLAPTGHPPGVPPELTVVIPTLDAGSERVRACLHAVKTGTEAAHEIVVVDNGAPPQGFSGPVNAGIRAANTPYVVVMNDDVEPLAGWWPPLRAALDGGAAVAFPFTLGGAMRFDFAAWCFAIHRDSVAEFAHAPDEFFDPELSIWYQDTDLLHRLRQAGRPPQCVESSLIRHGLSQTVASVDPKLASWIRLQVAADRERFLRKHPDAVLNGHALAAN